MITKLHVEGDLEVWILASDARPFVYYVQAEGLVEDFELRFKKTPRPIELLTAACIAVANYRSINVPEFEWGKVV